MAQKDTTYNGWSNYPTWCVNLWLSNDEGLWHRTQELIQVEGPDRGLVAGALKRFVRDDLAPDLGATFAADLLGYAIDEVDWYEIADAWLVEPGARQ